MSGIRAMEILKISIKSRDAKRNELLRTCQVISKAVLLETGCKASNFSQDIVNENLIYLEQAWEDRSYLEEHFKSDVFSALLGAMKLLSDSYEIHINDGPQAEGMAAVLASRSKQSSQQKEEIQ
ncbi:putative quinol monooxygenase [Thermodesulfobacteriota bacterium]